MLTEPRKVRNYFFWHFQFIKLLGGDDLYPGIEEKATNLLFFLDKNGLLYNSDRTKRITDNALAAITLMVAESKPQEKDIIVKVVVNFINKRNQINTVFL